ncbi:MAG TPA: cupin domain-containing protein [Gaiellales bacterium]|nr:cupin domain-containing protein [Gaiellales bacterium]
MIPEAGYEKAENGILPKGEGWFVVNAREAAWRDSDFGAYTRFEGDVHFPQIGINISVLTPGQPSCMYHGEDEQEDFLVLSGECLLLVEGEERRLKAWDFVHCPAWTEHVFVGAGDGPCALLAIGGRSDGDVIYPEAEVALRRGAGVEKTTKEPKEAYASYGHDVSTGFRKDWLPG